MDISISRCDLHQEFVAVCVRSFVEVTWKKLNAGGWVWTAVIEMTEQTSTKKVTPSVRDSDIRRSLKYSEHSLQNHSSYRVQSQHLTTLDLIVIFI